MLTVAILVAGIVTLASSSLVGAATQKRLVVKTPPYPIWAAYANGTVWVGTHHSNVIYRIAPATGRIVKRVIDSTTPCGEPATGFGSIYVGDCIDEGGNTIQISARSNKPVRELPGGNPVVGFGSVWTLSGSGSLVRRFDPRTGIVLARIPTNLSEGAAGGQESLGTAGAGSIWLGSETTKTVLRISAATNTVTNVIDLPGAATSATADQGYAGGAQMAYAGGKVFYGNPAGVFEIDPSTNTSQLLPIKIGALDDWGDITFATGLGSVWVRTSGTQLTRINPTSGNVVGTYPAAGGGGGMAIVGHSLWVANAGLGTTWREPVS
jgi:hypothetical protein